MSVLDNSRTFSFFVLFLQKLGGTKVLSSLDAAKKVSIILTDDFPCINTNDLKRWANLGVLLATELSHLMSPDSLINVKYQQYSCVVE